jgi:hypothetical protein
MMLLLTGASILVACAVDAPPPKGTPFDPGDPGFVGRDTLPNEEEPLPAIINADSGAFAPERPSGPTRPRRDDGGAPDPDAGPKVSCPPLVPGDLAIVEIMIASKTGSNDSGEWVEIQNTHATCWLEVKGISVESPRGSASSNVATMTESFEVPPHGTFVVADSLDPAENHGIGGKVISWNALDVLKNDTDSVIVKKGALVIDKLTYPSLTNATAGRSIAFPDNCLGADHTDWNRWSLAFDEYAPGYKGTPNEPNDDVLCF